MQSERDGKVSYLIEDIKFLKKSINMIVDGVTIRLDESTFSHFYLYKGKELSQEEMDEISAFLKSSKARNYVLKLLSNGLYSEKEIREKLLKRKLTPQEINKLIDNLKENHYIDDKRYMEEYTEIMERKNFGKKKIIQHLYDAGIEKEDYDKIFFDDEDECSKAELLAGKYIQHHQKLNKNQLKKGLYEYLIRNGFDEDIIYSVTDSKMKETDTDEKKLAQEVSKKYVLTHRLDLKNPDDYKKVSAYLARKGFKYEDINDVLRRK